MLALCDEATDNAQRIGAVNAVRRESDGRMVGEMLDGLGFVGGLRSARIEPRGMSAYVTGAGGAANAIAFALAEAGVARLTIANRSREKAEDLVARIARFLPRVRAEVGSRDPSGHDLTINATSLGLRDGDLLPFDADLLTPDQIAAEIIMQPQTTAMMAAAAARGCRVQPGIPMLACQLELMADFMSGRREVGSAGPSSSTIVFTVISRSTVKDLALSHSMKPLARSRPLILRSIRAATAFGPCVPASAADTSFLNPASRSDPSRTRRARRSTPSAVRFSRFTVDLRAIGGVDRSLCLSGDADRRFVIHPDQRDAKLKSIR
jgi:shikimate dehydrogenase